MIKFDNFSKPHKDKDMLNLDKFPLEIGALQRKQGSNTFLNDGRGMVCHIYPQENKISFALVRPAAAHLGSFIVKDEEEAIKIIKDFKVGDKKMSDYSPYNNDLDERISDLERYMVFIENTIDDLRKGESVFERRKLSNLEDKIVTLKNTIIDLEHRLDNLNDRLEAGYL